MRDRTDNDPLNKTDPIIPQYLREFVFEGPRETAAIAEGFRHEFAEAGWSKVVDTQTTENTGGPNGVSLAFTKGFGDWSALAEVYVSHPDDDGRGGLSTSLVASIDPIPCDRPT